MIRKKLLILGVALCLATSANIVTAFAEKADEGKFYETENPYLQTAVRALSAMSRIM